MGALTSIPLCQRVRAEQEDNNNNLAGTENRNLAQVPQVVEVQPEATSTPKIDSRRRIEPLPDEERDLGDSSNSDSLESELEVRAVSERTFGSDSGLEASGDELEITREVEVAEEDMEDLNMALEEEESAESLETGDLGVDRSTTFRTLSSVETEPPLDMDLLDLEAEFSEPLPNEEEEEEEESSLSRKLAELGVSEEQAITNILSDLTAGHINRNSEMARR